MKILMLSKALVVGPYQKKAEELARIPGVELLVVVPPVWQEPRGGPQRLEEQHVVGYDLHVAPMHLNGRYHFHYYPTIGRILRKFQPQVFHVDEEPYNFATWHAMQAGKRVGAKMCFFTWQNIPKRYPLPFARLERAVYAGMDVGVAGNQAALDILRDKGFTRPAAVIPQFGVDPNIYQPPPPKPRPANWIPTIGYIGRLVEEKGVQVLLEAVALLKQAYRVEIIGTGYYRTDLEVMASRLGIRDRIAFRNSVAPRDIPDVLSKLDILVVPSLTRANWMEQFGRVIIEAMACEVPVIGSDSGEIPFVIGDAGMIVPEGNREELALRIHDLLEDREVRADLAKRGRERVLKLYTQRQIAQRYYQVYSAMLGNGGMPTLYEPEPPPAPFTGPPPSPEAFRDAGVSRERPTPRPPRPPAPQAELGPEHDVVRGAERGNRRGPERGAERGVERGASRRPRPQPRTESRPVPEPHPDRSADFTDDLVEEPDYPAGYGRPTLDRRAARQAAEPDTVLPDPVRETEPEPEPEGEPTPPALPEWWPKRDIRPARRPERSWLYEE